ncbi:uncharacterized protein NECHADRAFT_123159 [Fusarium vanettenii 77-13-4]|uniref:RlpA-like protein double-psi beta-barrel domain-containing protein n=1 Tax=Fusarium vanettenii (strain ATCC MYA-4622 / CBS 123669 / FGSC 9596 / NRRL 45880 / 77-13-4) TaxID=660122 RepID=C7YS04_FUSV7|nr:uncharacterized protein NECHADRAFT_123159 [Fusarium vanettenii 77-13-4]EEU45161.1 hypothetical protein NECHADRAFT_123159 [Fusarium vanettenii 77-13-4]
MKSFTIASALFAAVAVAQPHGKIHGIHHRRHHQNAERDVVVTEVEWVTEYEYVTKMVDATTTVWITPGQEQAQPTTSEAAKFVETQAPSQPAPKIKKPAEKKPAPTTTLVTSVYTPPPPPPEPTTTTTEVKEVPKPKVTTYEAPEPVTTQQYVPEPEPTTSAAPAPAAPSTGSDSDDEEESNNGGSSGGSGGGSSAAKTGEFTYYDIGMGACGDDDSGKDESENIVALSHLLMGTVSNGNPMCGKTITIKANGKTTTAVVKDKCMGCAVNDIDVSKKCFKEISGDLDAGRIEVEWWFN